MKACPRGLIAVLPRAGSKVKRRLVDVLVATVASSIAHRFMAKSQVFAGKPPRPTSPDAKPRLGRTRRWKSGTHHGNKNPKQAERRPRTNVLIRRSGENVNGCKKHASSGADEGKGQRGRLADRCVRFTCLKPEPTSMLHLGRASNVAPIHLRLVSSQTFNHRSF